MSSYSVTAAKNDLLVLLAAAERGERVTITRYGSPIAELHPVAGGPKRVTAASIDWLEAQLAGSPPTSEDSVARLNALRDGGDG